ncbi:MAG: YkgJ family cysteine cluster protein [Treponema sp.]|nr:YkgJ family cysteine cluster protein [Treponema sp.]
MAKLEGTSVHDILVQMEESYDQISKEQNKWYTISGFNCPSGCGQCCVGFEPDIIENEALYMAAWLLENQRPVALKIANGCFPFNHTDGTCLFFNPQSPFHCSIYNGRAFICRLFGASSFHSKHEDKVWRPCKFYPDEYLANHTPPLQKRQYSESETKQIFGAVPPLMSELTAGTRGSAPAKTSLIHRILPQKIKWLLWIIDINNNGNDNPNGTPSPLSA